MWRPATLAIGVLCVIAGSSLAERVKNPVARFAGLDKITGTTTDFEVNVGAEGRFGKVIVKPFVCYTRPITEEPKTTSFVQIERLDPNGKRQKAFSGWMFAESPGLNAVEDPTFDVWLTGCFDPNAPPPPVEIPPTPETAVPDGDDADGADPAPAD